MGLPRCFPHCCPHHVARSYCGAPVHLQVDLIDTPSPVSTATPVDSEKEIVGDENLMVFGRFRVEKARGLVLGHKLSTDVLSHSLQSKANPTGDWIAAKLIASAGHNTWLFEVNASANWFYDWEVGAVRTRRAETHVFEVYVFYKRPSDLSNHFGVPTADVDGMPVSKKRAVQIETVEVVAIATSSPFTLLSFRRAPLQRRFSMSANGYDQEEQKQAVMQKTELQDDSSAINDSQDNVNAEMNLHELLKVPGTSTATPVCDDSTAVYDRLTPSVDQSPVVAATTNMAIVLWFLRQIPINVIATLSLLPSIECTLHASLVEHLAAEGAGLATALRGPLVDLNLTRAVASFVDSCGSLPRLVSVDPTDEDDDKVVIEALEAEFGQLAEIGAKLAIWMLFDRDNNARIEAFIQRSARVLLDKVALCKSYQTFAEWLQERIDEYLSQDQWYLEGLVKRIINWGYTCKSRGNRHELDGILSSDDSTIAAGYEVFVAHARGIYLSTLQISPLAQFAQTRIHPKPFMVRKVPPLESFPVPISIASFLQYSGLWMCNFELLSVRQFQLTPFSHNPPFPHEHTHVGVIPLLWFWKQLSCLRIAFSYERDVPALLFASIFNPSLAGDRVTRIVMDRQHHWFKCFPSGEATLGVRVQGHSFGDYVARAESGKVEIKSYSWPSSSSRLSTSAEAPLCWHWHLAIRADGPMLIVTVRIERGNLFPRSSNHTDKLNESSSSSSQSSSSGPFNWDTEPLNQKLAQVKSWEPLYELYLGYRKLE